MVHVDSQAAAGGDGTAARPFARLVDGLRAVAAGETLLVQGGEYRERIRLTGLSLDAGTAERPITVRAAPGERVVVRGILRLHDLQHWVIDGINVTWDAERNASNEHMVVLNGGASWTYRNSEVWGARSYAAILVAGSPRNWRLAGLHVHDTHPTNNLNQDHLIYCNCGSGGGVIERSLLVGSPNGRAVKVGTVADGDADIANVVIRHNTMVDNRGPSNIQLAYRTSNIVIERNIMVDPAPGRANVTTFELSARGDSAVRTNLGWGSARVLDPTSGLVDGGGNLRVDPQLDGTYRPRNPEAAAYGHLAP